MCFDRTGRLRAPRRPLQLQRTGAPSPPVRQRERPRRPAWVGLELKRKRAPHGPFLLRRWRSSAAGLAPAAMLVAMAAALAALRGGDARAGRSAGSADDPRTGHA